MQSKGPLCEIVSADSSVLLYSLPDFPSFSPRSELRLSTKNSSLCFWESAVDLRIALLAAHIGPETSAVDRDIGRIKATHSIGTAVRSLKEFTGLRIRIMRQWSRECSWGMGCFYSTPHRGVCQEDTEEDEQEKELAAPSLHVKADATRWFSHQNARFANTPHRPLALELWD